jgi:hypothetical protein
MYRYQHNKERKGKERKGKERKVKERKGKERKGKERYIRTYRAAKCLPFGSASVSFSS